MIVLADADLERAANAAVYYSMFNAGQTCISVERVYVEAPVYDEFVAQGHREGARAAPGRAGPGGRRRGRGDVRRRRSTSSRATSGRRRKGAQVVVGGHAATRRAAFFEPTVLVDVDHAMKCMREETFGPTLPIMKVADADEAVRLANDSRTGSPRRSSPRTPPAARRSRGASRPARCASTTRC